MEFSKAKNSVENWFPKIAYEKYESVLDEWKFH